MFGKVMRVPDAQLETYYQLLTEADPADFRRHIADDPRGAKVALAKQLIAWFHGAPAADEAEAEFRKIIVDKGLPDEMPDLAVGVGSHRLGPLLVQAGFCASNSEAVRKIKEGAVKLDGEKVPADAFNRDFDFAAPRVLQLGNRRFVRVRPGAG
jgi:tyrosyl-tRNA synthetase